MSEERKVTLSFIDTLLIVSSVWFLASMVFHVGNKIAKAIEANTAAVREVAK